jgi:hypothetical protein
MALAYALRLMEQDKNARLINYGSFLAPVSAHMGSRNLRQLLLELRPRRRALALQLRLQRRQGRLEPALASASARSTRPAPRHPRPAHRKGRQSALQRCLGRPRRLHRRHPRPQPKSVDRFFTAHQTILSPPKSVSARFELMEMQRHAQLMYTSCGWFFDDISGIETVQIIAYAARVIQLAQELFLEERRKASKAPSSTSWPRPNPTFPRPATARRSTPPVPRNMELSLEQVAAHYAISSVFSSFADETEIFCYQVHRISYEVFTSGRGRLALGRASVTRPSPARPRTSPYAVLHFGDQNITAAVKSPTIPKTPMPRSL